MYQHQTAGIIFLFWFHYSDVAFIHLYVRISVCVLPVWASRRTDWGGSSERRVPRWHNCPLKTPDLGRLTPGNRSVEKWKMKDTLLTNVFEIHSYWACAYYSIYYLCIFSSCRRNTGLNGHLSTQDSVLPAVSAGHKAHEDTFNLLFDLYIIKGDSRVLISGPLN